MYEQMPEPEQEKSDVWPKVVTGITYVVAISILALFGVSYVYFFSVLIIGLSTIITLSDMKTKKANKKDIETQQTPAEPVVNDAGLPILKL